MFKIYSEADANNSNYYWATASRCCEEVFGLPELNKCSRPHHNTKHPTHRGIVHKILRISIPPAPVRELAIRGDFSSPDVKPKIKLSMLSNITDKAIPKLTLTVDSAIEQPPHVVALARSASGILK
ncbi:MAG: hypothetical protein LBJ00_01360 [Planctomycetaceae bacterium]|nr:hypothetical protein [Planctomycetaceae bacterium]